MYVAILITLHNKQNTLNQITVCVSCAQSTIKKQKINRWCEFAVTCYQTSYCLLLNPEQGWKGVFMQNKAIFWTKNV